MSPTARTLGLLRQQGYTAGVVERWLPFARNGQGARSDLFGAFDVLAIRAGFPVLAVQCSSSGGIAARLKKLRALPAVRIWLACGCQAEVWGWAQHDGRWVVRRVALSPGDLEPVDLTPRPRPRRQRSGERQQELFET